MLPPPPMFDEPGEPLGPLPQPIISVEPKPQPPPPPPDQQTVNSIGQLLGASIFQEPQGLIPVSFIQTDWTVFDFGPTSNRSASNTFP